nr:geranylgeranyl reductase [uncultured crenarchaeote]
MAEMDYDVVVVGGSSTGLIAARESAKRGLRTVVFEEDKVIGRPEKCAGLYSIEGVRSLNIPVQGPYLQNIVRGAVFVSPSGKRFEVDASRDVAVVYNRERLDLFLAQQAAEAGAEIHVDTRVTEVKSSGQNLIVKTSSQTISTRHVISAEGRTATVARQMLPRYRTGKWLPIIQYMIANHGNSPDMVYLYFKKYLPEFFGYLVPVDDEFGKLGVAASKGTQLLVDKLLRENFPHAKVVGIMSSAIYVGGPLEPMRVGNFFLAGEVAGQVKATTGGGVVTGGKAAEAAAQHIAGQGTYEQLYRETLHELKGTFALRRLIEHLSPKHIDLILSSLADSDYGHVFAKVGDMDKHRSTLARALASKTSIKLTLNIVSRMLTGAYV